MSKERNFNVQIINDNNLKGIESVIGGYPLRKREHKDILATGYLSTIKVGDISIDFYPHIYYSEDNNAFALIMNNGVISRDAIVEKVRGMGYTKKDFVTINKQAIGSNTTQPLELDDRQVWIANNEDTIKEALEDSLGKGTDTCDCYLKIKGSIGIEIPYLTTTLPIEGVIVLPDKIVLLLNQKKKKNSIIVQANEAIKGAGFTPDIKEDSCLPF